ncbi:MAG TPA: response regulator, partial [Anaerolineaceae bacterium]
MDHDRPWEIVLVEDDEDDYILTRTLLSDARQDHFNLVWASQYEEGFRLAQSGRFDVCLVDHFLGEFTGLELVKRLHSAGCLTPLVVMTGQGSYEIDMEAMKAGATDYLVKGDLSPWSLERAIRYALDRKKAEDTLRAANELLAQARDELEQRVAARTRELAEANQGLRAEIAERQRIEAALRQSETLFRTLAETTSSAIFIVRDAKILYANPAVKYITGYSPEELYGLEFWEIAHPAYREVLKKAGLKPGWVDG